SLSSFLESSPIYLVNQSAVLQGAARGSYVLDHMLAAIIWHEMAHLEGAPEPEAQRREQELWTTFIRDRRVDQTVGCDTSWSSRRTGSRCCVASGRIPNAQPSRWSTSARRFWRTRCF